MKTQLTADDPAGWYSCNYLNLDAIRFRYWDGKQLTTDTDEGGDCVVDNYTNFCRFYTEADVTDLHGLWSEEDFEIVSTQFSHPSITSGQHTNGPASVWWRKIGGDWQPSPSRSYRKTLAWLSEQREVTQ